MLTVRKRIGLARVWLLGRDDWSRSGRHRAGRVVVDDPGGALARAANGAFSPDLERRRKPSDMFTERGVTNRVSHVMNEQYAPR